MVKVVDNNYIWGVLPGPFVVIASMVWPVMVCITTFTLFYVYHPNATDKVRTVEQIPTISGTGELVPESVVFTFGLHVEAGLVALLFILIYTVFESQIREIALRTTLTERLRTDTFATEHRGTQLCASEKWKMICCPSKSQSRECTEYLRFWNTTLLVLGLFAALFMALTGSVTLNVHEPTHTAFAAIMFVFATLHMIVFYFTIAEPLGAQPYQHTLHTVCLIVVVPFNIAMIIVLRVMLAYCTARTCIAAAVDLMVVLEYTTTVAFLVYMFRFYDVVKHVSAGSFVRSAALPLQEAPGRHGQREAGDVEAGAGSSGEEAKEAKTEIDAGGMGSRGKRSQGVVKMPGAGAAGRGYYVEPVERKGEGQVARATVHSGGAIV